MRRSSPPLPLNISSGRPIASERLFSRPATVTAEDTSMPNAQCPDARDALLKWRRPPRVSLSVADRASGRSLCFGLDQPEVAIRPAEQHGDRVAGRIAEHDHRIVAVADFRGRVLDAH